MRCVCGGGVYSCIVVVCGMVVLRVMCQWCGGVWVWCGVVGCQWCGLDMVCGGGSACGVW